MANYTGNSIVDYLKSVGKPSDYGSRSKLAQQYGISGYAGTAQQNTQLLGFLQTPQATPAAPPAQTAAEKQREVIAQTYQSRGAPVPQQYQQPAYVAPKPPEKPKDWSAYDRSGKQVSMHGLTSDYDNWMRRYGHTTELQTTQTQPTGVVIGGKSYASQDEYNRQQTQQQPQQQPVQQQPTEPAGTYLIQSGDNLSKIAQRHNTTVSAIMSINPQIKDENMIYAGDILNIPGQVVPVQQQAPGGGGIIPPEPPKPPVPPSVPPEPPVKPPLEPEAPTPEQQQMMNVHGATIEQINDPEWIRGKIGEITETIGTLEVGLDRENKIQELVELAASMGVDYPIEAITALSGAKEKSEQDFKDELYEKYGIEDLEEKFQERPEQTFEEMYSTIATDLGLADLKQQIQDVIAKIDKADEDYGTASDKINENPWLSEAGRVGQQRRLTESYEKTRSRLDNQMLLVENLYGRGKEDAERVATRAMNTFQKEREWTKEELDHFVMRADNELVARLELQEEEKEKKGWRYFGKYLETYEKDEMDLLSPTEAKTLGVPYGTSKQQAAQMDIIPGITTTREDITGFDLVAARALSTKLYGKRKGGDPAYLNPILDLMAEGRTIDDIEDELRYTGVSSEFQGTFKGAFEYITKSKFTTADRTSSREYLDELLEEGEIPEAVDFILGLARDKGTVEERKSVAGREDALNALDEIELLLNKYIEKGGNTGLISGNYEKFQENILKRTDDPELAEIGNEIAIIVQRYRQLLTGAAFTESEAKEYARLFPSIEKSPELNLALITSMRNSYNRYQKGYYKRTMGSTNYDALENILSTGGEIGNDDPFGILGDEINLANDNPLNLSLSEKETVKKQSIVEEKEPIVEEKAKIKPYKPFQFGNQFGGF